MIGYDSPPPKTAEKKPSAPPTPLDSKDDEIKRLRFYLERIAAYEWSSGTGDTRPLCESVATMMHVLAEMALDGSPIECVTHKNA